MSFPGESLPTNRKKNVNPNAPCVPTESKLKSKLAIRSALGEQVSSGASGSRTAPVKPKPASVTYASIPKKLKRLVDLNLRYPDRKFLKDLGIDFHPGALDLSTGLNLPLIQHYKPVSVKCVKEFLDITGGLEARKDSYNDNFCTGDEHMLRDGCQGEARAFFHMMITHLKANPSGSDGKIIGGKVNWSTEFIYDSDFLTQCREKVNGWEPAKVMTYSPRLESGEVDVFRRHPEFPHVIAFVAAEDLPNERLSAGEVAALLCLARDYSKKITDLDEFPILILSATNRHARFVQACYHRKTQAFSVSTSRTLQFYQGIKANMDEYLQLLGWFIAEPTWE